MPNKKNVTIGFLLAAMLSLTASTALAQRRSSPIALVPNSAVAVAKINWTVVRQDNYFRAMFKTEDMARALSQLNVGGNQITDLLVFSGINSSRSVIDKIGFPHALGFSMERQGTNFPTNLVAQMKDPTSAALISGTLNLAQTVNLSVLSNRMPASDREMLKNISITRTGALLSIRMVLREQDLPRPAR